MKMRDVVRETRVWKEDYLNTDVVVAEKRKQYCIKQTNSGRKDSFKIWQEARRKYK